MLSVAPTPAPVALARKVTVVPVTERTVVPAGMTVGAVTSSTVMPAVIHAGVEAKCSVGLPLAVVAVDGRRPGDLNPRIGVAADFGEAGPVVRADGGDQAEPDARQGGHGLEAGHAS